MIETEVFNGTLLFNETSLAHGETGIDQGESCVMVFGDFPTTRWENITYPL
jgi:hypothetical protein